MVLWILQGAIYSLFFNNSTGNYVMGGVGFGVGVLISAVETIAFFIITELTLAPAASLILTGVLAPVYLTSLVFRFVQRVFEPKAPEDKESGSSSEQSPRPDAPPIIDAAPANIEAK